MATRWASPPDSVRACRSARCATPSASSHGRASRRARARRIPRSRRPAAALSSTEARCRTGRCSTAATAARSCVGATGSPSRSTSPHVAAGSRRASARSSVDFPAPFGTEHGHRLAVGDLQEVHREQVTAAVRDPQVPAADAHGR